MARPAYDPSREDLYHVAGDMDTGVTTSANLTGGAAGHPQIRYSGRAGDFVMTADVYIADNEVMVHLICPKCRNALSIKNKNKQLDYNIVTQELSVEPFSCSWELGHSDATKNDHMDFGIGLCRHRMAIDKNVAKDA